MGPSNMLSLSFREMIHFHDYGRKGIFQVNLIQLSFRHAMATR